MSSLLVVIPLIAVLSQERTAGRTDRLAQLNLAGARLVERPEDWQPHVSAKAEFRAAWCAREGYADCTDLGDRQEGFEAEWRSRRDGTLSGLRKPGLNPVTRTEADDQVTGIELHISEPDPFAQHREALAQFSQTSGFDLRGADLRDGFLPGTSFVVADLSDATLTEAQMEGAILTGALLTGTADRLNELRSTNLSASTNDGGALRFVDLRPADLGAADWRNVFLDDTVLLPDGVREAMGGLCQRIARPDGENDPVSEAAFFGAWRGWIEAAPPELSVWPWRFIAPPGWEHVAAIPPREGCVWKTGPLPGAEGGGGEGARGQ